jgi:hypothetical protein
MAYAFKASNKLKPVLHTQYTQNPAVNKKQKEYIPGLRHINPVPDFKPIASKYIIQIKTAFGKLTYENTALPDTQTQDIWDGIHLRVFELFGNDPVVYGTLQGLRDTQSGIMYQYGCNIPARNGIFTPIVIF